MTIALEQIRQISMGQRLQLVEDIWDTIANEDADLSVSSSQCSELHTRRAAMLADLSIGIPWTEAKALLQTGSPNAIRRSCAKG